MGHGEASRRAEGDFPGFQGIQHRNGQGGKREAASYRNILKHIGLPGEQVLFLSDIGEELDAAQAAGMKTCQLLRDDRTKPAAHTQVGKLTDVAV